jgi:glutathione synthase/RimK-type ligase-like ATP-grasp enzyme
MLVEVGAVEQIPLIPSEISNMIRSARSALETVTGEVDTFETRAECVYREAFARDTDQSLNAHRFGMFLETVLSAYAQELTQSGDKRSAEQLLTFRVSKQPEYFSGLPALARLYISGRRFDKARNVIDCALLADPDSARAHSELAWLYENTQRPQEAAHHWRLAYPNGIIRRDHYMGTGVPTRVLIIMSLLPGCMYYQKFLEPRHCDITSMTIEAYTATLPLPEHDVIVMGVSDADLCAYALERAKEIIARSSAPVINRPEAVERTSRVEVSQRLAQIPGVKTPKILRMSREAIEDRRGVSYPRERGFDFPFLLRSPGFQNGEHFEMVSTERHYQKAVRTLPGDELLAIEYMQTEREDGTFRKYRVFCIDGKLYPIHLAISNHWKIHYDSSVMHEREECRREEHRFLSDMRDTLGLGIMRSLHDIFETLGLDYAGIDFSIDAMGRLVVFEANATMALWKAADDEMWDYRRPAIENACKAAREMVFRGAKPFDTIDR